MNHAQNIPGLSPSDEFPNRARSVFVPPQFYNNGDFKDSGSNLKEIQKQQGQSAHQLMDREERANPFHSERLKTSTIQIRQTISNNNAPTTKRVLQESAI